MMLPVVPFHGGRQDERPDSIHFLVIRTGIAADGFPRQDEGVQIVAVESGEVAGFVADLCQYAVA